MSFLQIWFAATAVVVVGFLMWAYVPILIPLLALTAALGALTFGIVSLARFAEKAIKRRDGDNTR
jgi:membrane associated rhomboid family serine protease